MLFLQIWLLPVSSSHRQILRATAIVGGASAINIVVGLVRNKAAALILGPAGIGVIGLLLSLVTTVSGIAGLGVGNAAVRQIASDADAMAQARTRRALWQLTLGLTLTGMLATWLLRRPLAGLLLGDEAAAGQVGWLALAVGLTIWSSGQGAVLNGLRRLRDLAGAQVLGGLLGTILGIAAVAMWREDGILAYVIAAPLAGAIASAWFVARLPRPPTVRGMSWPVMAPMLRLGIPMMIGGIMLSAGALAIRALIGTRIGAVELGGFTAAWTLSVTYVGFVLGAMGTDYLPRLTAVIGDKEAACRSVNEQAEISLLLALPVMLGMQAAAPWVVWLLYSKEFAGAVEVLRWLIVADVMKVVAWPLGFVIIAQARAKTFLATEVTTLGVTLGVMALLVDRVGIQAAGIGYCASYVFYIAGVGGLARRSLGWRPSGAMLRLALVGLTVTIATGLIGAAAPLAGLVGGGMMTAAMGTYSLHRLLRLDALPAAVSRFLPARLRA
jgi:O-antigen/teichoic acid export membrane protein